MLTRFGDAQEEILDRNRIDISSDREGGASAVRPDAEAQERFVERFDFGDERATLGDLFLACLPQTIWHIQIEGVARRRGGLRSKNWIALLIQEVLHRTGCLRRERNAGTGRPMHGKLASLDTAFLARPRIHRGAIYREPTSEYSGSCAARCRDTPTGLTRRNERESKSSSLAPPHFNLMQ